MGFQEIRRPVSKEQQMIVELKALIERLRNPQWIIPDGHLDTVKTLADMKAAADRLERLLPKSD
jgi:hypothetical protein